MFYPHTIKGKVNLRLDIISGLPLNSLLPVISGDKAIGDLLTVTPGSWTGTGTIILTYQWLRDGADITGETATTYTIVLADEGNEITCREFATDDAGTSQAVSNSLIAGEGPDGNYFQVLEEQTGRNNWAPTFALAEAATDFESDIDSFTKAAMDYDSIVNRTKILRAARKIILDPENPPTSLVISYKANASDAIPEETKYHFIWSQTLPATGADFRTWAIIGTIDPDEDGLTLRNFDASTIIPSIDLNKKVLLGVIGVQDYEAADFNTWPTNLADGSASFAQIHDIIIS